MGKRGNNEGSIFQRADGRWAGQVHLGYGEGKRLRRTFYGATQSEVIEKVKAAQSAIRSGLPLPPDRLTVGALLDQWLEEVVRPKNRPATYERHAGIVRAHLKPTLGHVRLAKLTPVQVQSLLNAKSTAKGKNGRSLSPRTVRYIRLILGSALRHAMRWGYIGINVAALTDAPRVAPYHVEALSPDAARKLLDAISSHRFRNLFICARATGARQGELLGARWRDIDLDAGIMRIKTSLQRIDGEYQLVEPKTAKSRRTLALPAIAIEALHEQRARWAADRLAAGERWADLDLVFCLSDGSPLHGPTVTRQFQAQLKDAGLPRVRFHDLRHGAATLMLSQGVPLKVVQETLGRATIAVTADVYGHLLPELQKDAAQRMDNALRGTV